jgi:hypothetical protein
MRFASLLIVLGVGTATAQPALQDTPTTAPVSAPAVTPVAPVEQPQLVRQEIVYEVDPGAARKRTALWLFLGGSALVVASNQLSWYEKTQWERAVGTAGMPTTYDQVDAANNAVHIARYVATPLFVAGVAGIGAAAYMYFTAAKSERVHKTVWLPAVDSGQAGVAVAGRF